MRGEGLWQYLNSPRLRAIWEQAASAYVEEYATGRISQGRMESKWAQSAEIVKRFEVVSGEVFINFETRYLGELSRSGLPCKKLPPNLWNGLAARCEILHGFVNALIERATL